MALRDHISVGKSSIEVDSVFSECSSDSVIGEESIDSSIKSSINCSSDTSSFSAAGY